MDFVGTHDFAESVEKLEGKASMVFILIFFLKSSDKASERALKV